MTTLRTELPVRFSSILGYHADRWAAMGDVVRGFNGTTLRMGYEQHCGVVELRGGGRSSWHR